MPMLTDTSCAVCTRYASEIADCKSLFLSLFCNMESLSLWSQMSGYALQQMSTTSKGALKPFPFISLERWRG